MMKDWWNLNSEVTNYSPWKSPELIIQFYTMMQLEAVARLYRSLTRLQLFLQCAYQYKQDLSRNLSCKSNRFWFVFCSPLSCKCAARCAWMDRHLPRKAGHPWHQPLTLLASKGSLPQGRSKCHRCHCHLKSEYFWEQVHYHRQLQILVL